MSSKKHRAQTQSNAHHSAVGRGSILFLFHLVLSFGALAEPRADETCARPEALSGTEWRIEAKGLRRRALHSFASLGERAGNQFNAIMRIAELTRIHIVTIVDVTEKLLQAGFTSGQLDGGRAAVLDAMSTDGIQAGKDLVSELIQAQHMGALDKALGRVLIVYGDGKSLGAAAKSTLSKCIEAMSQKCTAQEAAAYCNGTPREYLDLVHMELPLAVSPKRPQQLHARHQEEVSNAEVEAELDRSRQVDLVLACRKLVKERLIAPDEATFASWLDALPDTTPTSGGRYQWTDWVKAKNPLGVVLRRTFTCTYRASDQNLKMDLD